MTTDLSRAFFSALNSLIKISVGFLAVAIMFLGQPAFSAGADLLTLSTQPSPTEVDGIALAVQPVVTVTNNGSAVSGANVTASIGSGTGTLQNTTATTNSSGVATFSGLTITGTAGVFTLTFSENGSTVTSGNIAVSVGAVTKIVIANSPSTSGTNGVALPTQPVIYAEDVGGNINTTATGTVTASMNNHTITNPTASLSSGVATFNGLSIAGPAGTFPLIFSYNGMNVQLPSINILVGAGTQLVFATSPSAQAASGAPLSVQPILNTGDSGGNLVTSATGTVTASVTSGTATLSGATATITNGVATFTNLTITGSAGTVTLQFSSSGLSPISSASITLAGTPTKLAISTAPSTSAGTGIALVTQPIISIQDSSNHVNTAATGTVTASVTSGTATLSGATATITNGAATFTNLTINGSPGNVVLTFSSGSLTSVASSTIALGAGAAATLLITSQPSLSATNGVALTSQPVVKVQDSNGTVVTSATGSITATIQSGNGTLSNSTSPITNGIATFSGLAINGKIGSFTISFSYGSATPVTSQSITLSAGAATQLGITTAPSSANSSNTAFSTQPVIAAQDSSGNTVSSASGTVTAAIASGSGYLYNTIAYLNNGIATFSGMYATSSNGSNIAISFSSGSFTSVTSDSITIAGAPSQLIIVIQPSTLGTVGYALTIQPKVKVADASGNLVTSASGFVIASLSNSSASLSGNSISISGGYATFTSLQFSGAPGTYTMQFQFNGINSSQSSQITVAGTPWKLQIQTYPSSTAVNGVVISQQPVIQVVDSGGRLVTAASGTVSAIVNSVQTGSSAIIFGGVATFTNLSIQGLVGPVTVGFRSLGLLDTPLTTVLLSVGQPYQVVITSLPSTATTSGIPLLRQPSVSVADIGGNTVTSSTGSITVTVATGSGTLQNSSATIQNGVATFSGLTITGAPGNITLNFSFLALKTATSSSIVINGPPAKLQIVTPPSANATSGFPFSTQPVVQLVDAMGNLVTTATGTVTATLLSATGSLQNETATVINGVAEFTDLTVIGASGAFSISFTSGELTPANYTSIVTSLPAPLSESFSGTSSSLSNVQKIQIRNFVRKWTTGAKVTITGYAKGNRALALKRARAIGLYMRTLGFLDVSYVVNTTLSASKAVAKVMP